MSSKPPERSTSRDGRRWTVMEVLDWSHRHLAARGCRRPRLDAELLLSDILGMDRLGLYTNFDRPMTMRERAAFRQALRRRAAGEPVAYILGFKEFFSLKFKVNEHVMIPRPETELLVEKVLEEKPSNPIADVCTGSGCVAVALASRLEHADILASDISREAISVAAANIDDNGVVVRLFRGDLFDAFPANMKFGAIVSNPPYIRSSDIEGLGPELSYEPRLALDGGGDGLSVIRRLVADGARMLLDGGFLLFEIGSDQAEAALELMRRSGLEDLDVLKDLAGLDRAVFGRKVA